MSFANSAVAVLLMILLGFVAAGLFGLIADCLEYVLVTIDERINRARIEK